MKKFEVGEVVIYQNGDSFELGIVKSVNEDKITQEVIDDLDNFDGCDAKKSDWDDLVKDRELYVVEGKDGRITKVKRRFVE